MTRFSRLEHDERRRQILDAARRLFGERHYGAVSTADVAAEAGVTRGLVHHYFGGKRELFLEVVDSMMRMPALPVPEELVEGELEDVIEDASDRWLDMIERNRDIWLAVVGARGFGRDPEMERLVEDAEASAARRILALLYAGDPDSAPAEVWALIGAWNGFVHAATIEWLERGRLTREQVGVLLVQGFLRMVGDVLPLLAVPVGKVPASE
jgi:AcrR family transcriptional regulator